MKTAKAAVFTQVNKAFELKEFPLTAPEAGMAKIKLLASGICGTDLHIFHGRLGIQPPKILGHEFIGRVEELCLEDSLSTGIKPGDAVIVDIACPCGTCALCASGDDANCVHMGVTNGGDPDTAPHFWGGYGEYNYSPVKNLVKLPVDLDPVVAGAFACAGPTICHAVSLAEKAGCKPEKAQLAVVQGTGPIGCFAIALLHSLGVPHIFAIHSQRNAEKEALAKSFGAEQVFSLNEDTEEMILQVILKHSEGLGADLVVEASGARNAVPFGMQVLRNRGVYLIPGQYSDRGVVEIHPELITFKALQLIGSSQYSLADVAAYLQFMQNSPALYDTIRDMLTLYPLEKINDAFRDAEQHKNCKAMLVP